MSTVTDARQVRTREKLHRTILEAIAVEPLHAITVREIARKAGIGYATFFRHYPSKEALLEDAAASEIRRLVELSLPLLSERGGRVACERLCDEIAGDWPRWGALLTGSTLATVRQELLRVSMAVAEDRESGQTWPPHEVATAVVVGSMLEILSWWLRQDSPPSAKRVAGLLYDRAVAPGLPPGP